MSDADVDLMSVSFCTQPLCPLPVINLPIPQIFTFTAGIIAGIVIASLILISLIGGLFVLLATTIRQQLRKRRHNVDDHDVVHLSVQTEIEKFVFPEVTVIKKIPSGNSSEIYIGHSHFNSSSVSMRKLRVKETDDTIAEFSKELSTLMSLKHPNVVTCFGVYKNEQEDLFFVSEYVSSGSVLDWLTVDQKEKDGKDLLKM